MGEGVVQRVEVVVDRLHLGTLGDVEAQADEHILDLAAGAGHQVQAADRGQRVGGQRDVDAVLGQARLQLGGGQLSPALLERAFQRLPGLVRLLAGGGAVLRGQLRHAPQQVRKLRLAAQVADAHVLERRGVRRRLNRRGGLALDLGDPLGGGTHSRAILIASYSATVAAMAALSDWVAMGIRPTSSAPSMTSRGSPSRSAPTSNVTSCRSSSARGTPSSATSAT